MKVKTLCHLKLGSRIIDEGTIFEGDEDTLPDFVQSELKENRGTVEILPEVKKKIAGRPRKTEIPVEEALSKSKTPKPSVKPKKKSNLREKLKNVG